MHKLLFASLLILCCVPLAVAQSSERSRFEFFAGYSVLRTRYEAEQTNPPMPVGVAFAGKQTMNGFNASATVSLAGGFGLTGDFSGHFKTHSLPDPLGGNIETHIRVFNVLVGPQYRFAGNRRVTPFVRALGGVANTRARIEVPQPQCYGDTKFDGLRVGPGRRTRCAS